MYTNSFCSAFLSLYLIWNFTLGPSYVISKLTPQIQVFIIQVPFLIYTFMSCQFSSITQSCLMLCDPMDYSMPGLPVLPRACSNSCPSSWWWHATISSSMVPFSSCLQSFPASGSFQMSRFFASGGQSIRISASASVLALNIQDWFPLGWTGWISLPYKGLSRVFSNITVQKHQFFGT